MSGIENISIDFLSDQLLWVVLFYLILLGLSFYLYRRTNPPISKTLKILLVFLRVVAVSAIFIALSEPVITIFKNYERPRKIALLKDISLSMNEVELDKSRASRLDSLLSNSAFERFSELTEVTTYYVGDKLSDDRQAVGADATALGLALKELNELEIGSRSDYWLLLSDGNSNSDIDPRLAAQQLNVPVITVDLSSGSDKFDLAIEDINYNPVIFAGQSSEIKLNFSWNNTSDQTVNIELIDSNRVVTQKLFNIRQSEGEAEVALEYTPITPGQKFLSVSIPPLSGEENPTNNRRTFSIKVLKSRLKVLLACEAPDYEVSFLKKFFDRVDKYDLDLIVTGPNAGNLTGSIPSKQTELNRYDLIILYDLPAQRINSRVEVFDSYLKEKGGSLWVLTGERASKDIYNDKFNSLLPFYSNKANNLVYGEFNAVPIEGQLYHPALRLGESQADIRKIWSEQPPFRTLYINNQLNQNGVVLAQVLDNKSKVAYPVIGYLRSGPGKVLSSSVLPFWNWGFVQLGLDGDNTYYSRFIEGIASWLTVSDDLEPIRLASQKDIYHRGETVKFDGFAYDLGFRPLEGVTGQIAVVNNADQSSNETDLLSQTEGAFRAEFYNLSSGNYSYQAHFEKDGRLLKEISGRFKIESYSLEEFNTAGKPEVLRAIAQATGGSYNRYDRFDEALNSLAIDKVTIEETSEFSLWNKFWLLMVFIGAISLEWLLRKMNQLL